MKEVFKQLRDAKTPKTFAASLFPVRWWRKALEARPEGLQPPPKEKLETLNSLHQFVEEKRASGQKSIRFPGGEIVSKESSLASNSQESLPQLDEFYDDLSGCSCCEATQNGPIFMKATPPIEVLFVADFPKENGQEGILPEKNNQLLSKIAAAMKLSRAEFAVSLSVKCFSKSEMTTVWQDMGKNCVQLLKKEIALLRPKVVVTLGAVASRLLLEKDVKLSSVHGKFHPQKLIFGESAFEYQVVPIFQLDLLMINPNMKKTAWADLQEIMKYLGRL